MVEYYQQILKDEYSLGARVKRAFQIVGLIHFLIALMLTVYFAIIFWVLLIIPLVVFLVGIIWGWLSYLFSTDYKYEYDNGILTIFYKNSYGNYKEIIKGNAIILKDQTFYKGVKSLTNLKNGVIISIDGQVVKISPNTYLETLLIYEK